ncbi:hypothetical protein ACFPM7_11290 [Actinokineospora guangxiensis]|uniref:APA family basic amino acid/polyamine antiporter n=1 Tax=Actinokineospora guangxiensis TaxID=1490288 RepID=A0ABW0EJQ6_9PSEU
MTELGQVKAATSAMVPGSLLTAAAAGVLAAAAALAEAGVFALAALVLTALAAGLTAMSLADLTAVHGPMSGYAHVTAVRGVWGGRIAGVLALAGRVVAAGALAALAGPAVLPSAPGVVSALVVVAAGALVVTRVRVPAPVLYVVIVTIGVIVVACLAVAPVAAAGDVAGADDWRGTVSAAGLLFLGFAGLDRLAGARPVKALALVAGATAVLGVVVYAVLRQLGGPRAAVSPAPLRDALAAADGTALRPLLVLGVAALAVLAVRPLLADAARVAGEMPELPGRAAVSGVVVVACAGLVALALPAGFAAALAATLLLGYFAMVNSAARALERCQRSTWVRTGCCGLALCVVLSVNVSVPALGVGAALLGVGVLACWASARRHDR